MAIREAVRAPRGRGRRRRCCAQAYELTQRYPDRGGRWNASRWRGVFAADMIRLAVLAKYGGVYLDMDVETLAPFAAVLQRCSRTGVLTWEPRVYRGGERWKEDGPPTFLNVATMATPRGGTPLLNRIADGIARRVLDRGIGGARNAVYLTGPVVAPSPSPAPRPRTRSNRSTRLQQLSSILRSRTASPGCHRPTAC